MFAGLNLSILYRVISTELFINNYLWYTNFMKLTKKLWTNGNRIKWNSEELNGEALCIQQHVNISMRTRKRSFFSFQSSSSHQTLASSFRMYMDINERYTWITTKLSCWKRRKLAIPVHLTICYKTSKLPFSCTGRLCRYSPTKKGHLWLLKTLLSQYRNGLRPKAT